MLAKYTLIDQNHDLEPLLSEVSRHEIIAIDTEADSMHHYREKLCLIQLGVGERQWIVDPLAPGLELEPLVRLLESRTLLLHGADYDLRLFQRTFGFKPAMIFDTMLAAQLLGKPRIGLAALVQEICETILSKEAQKADWSRRPLTENLLTYAADDTRYLHRVANELKRELDERGRWEWHREICDRLIEAAQEPRRVQDEDAWRVKGGKHLAGRPAAVLRELWAWREEHARQCDRPPFKIANPEFLVQWANWSAENPEATLEDAPDRPDWLRGGRLKTFDKALATGLSLAPDLWPGPFRGHGSTRITREEDALLRQVIDARDELAEQLGLDPGVLGAREALKALVRQHPRTEGELRAKSTLMAWQNECLLPVILPLLQTAAQPDASAV